MIRVEKTDVLIVGAGPAGCAAGILLVRAGYRVVILEKHGPGHSKTCGDLLGPRSLWWLHAMRIGWQGRGWQGMPIRSIAVFDEKDRRSWAPFLRTDRGQPPAETVRRDRFDAYLQAGAEAAGCSVLYRTAYRRVLQERESSVVCLATEGSTPRRFETRVLVGSDGAASTVAGSVRRAAPRRNQGIVAARGYYGGVEGLRDGIELYFMRAYLPGYAWVIPVAPGVANVGLGLRLEACLRRRIRPVDAVARFVEEHPQLSRRMKRAELLAPVRGWTIPTYARGVTRSAPHTLLLGDAAGCADPLSGEGIFGALQSACLAVPIVREALDRGDFSAGLLTGYDRAVDRYFGPAYRYRGWLASLPSDHRVLRPMVQWGLGRVSRGGLMDRGYARRVSGFFAGTVPGKRMWNIHWFLRTFLG